MEKIQMSRRKLRDLEVSSIGYGCMGLSHGYGPTPPKEEAIKIIKKAYEIGYTFFDTAEVYGHGENEELVGAALKDIRDKVEIATKLHIVDPSEGYEKIIRRHLEESMKRLQTNYVDLYYLHRCPSTINVEEVAKVMGMLIKEKKIKGWGLSQVDAQTIRKAHAITPLTAIQSEFSLMERMFEKEVIPTCKELRIGFVPFSPLASGFLSGGAKPNEAYVGDDVRRAITRFEGTNVQKNQPLMDLVSKWAKKKNCTTSQISLAWMLNKYPFLSPIPGSKTLSRIEENAKAALVKLTDEELNEFETELSGITIYGNRTDEAIMAMGHVKLIK